MSESFTVRIANCDILFDELSNAKQLHVPTERVKFNKRKQSSTMDEQRLIKENK